MRKFVNQYGLEMIEIAIITGILAVLGVITLIVWVSQQNGGTTTTPQTSANAQPEPSWQKGDIAISGAFYAPDVIQVNEKQWRMYYAAQPDATGKANGIFSAISSDGKNWTPEAGIRRANADLPAVIKLPDGQYRMYFVQGNIIKSALSKDGLTFTDELGDRIDSANPDNLTLTSIAAPTVTQLSDGTYLLMYRGTLNQAYSASPVNTPTRLLLWATSTDGLTFIKKGVAVDSRDSTLNGYLDGPDLVKWDDGSVRVYATSFSGVWWFGFDGNNFGKGTLTYTGGVTQNSSGSYNGTPPSHPTLASIHGTWFMYYSTDQIASGIRYVTAAGK